MVEKINMKKSQTYKNLAMNIIAFGVQFIINFYVSPVIVSKVGASAYGFIGLANDFVSYASIIATVFNSVASRFIANAFYKKEYDKANYYFNSLVVANFAVSGVLGVAGIVFVPNIDKFLAVSVSLLFDVKLTFALIFLSYIVSLVTLVFTTSTFVTNRTDIQGVRNIINSIIKFALIVVLLNFISVRIYWVALATLIATVVVAVMNIGLTKTLTPELIVNTKYARKKYAIELAKSGGWMTFTSISGVLLRGLDLTVANVTLGDYEMGLLSVARTIPNNVASIVATLAPIFTPAFIAFYARNDVKSLIEDVRRTIKVMAYILFVPISGFIVFSHDFYSLWQSSLTSSEVITVTVLSTLTIIQTYFDATTATMAQLSVVVNKLKIPVFVSFCCGIISLVAELLLIKYTSLGLYAIVLSTALIMIIRYVIFNSVYAAYCLEQPKGCFFLAVVKTWLSIPILIITMMAVRFVMPVQSWMDLCLDAVVCGVLGYIEMIVIYNRKSIKAVINKIRMKIVK